MGAIYLIRHGQASFGQADYDRLSPTGHQQSRVLGEGLKHLGLDVHATVRGSMRRHAETATACLEAMGHDEDSRIDEGFNEYDHDEGCSVTGGYVYRGTALPQLAGRYFFGDYCTGFVRSFRYEGGAAVDVQDHTTDLGTIGGLSSFGEDATGELYLLDIQGIVYRLVAPD